jgi:hypothetical protein
VGYVRSKYYCNRQMGKNAAMGGEILFSDNNIHPPTPGEGPGRPALQAPAGIQHNLVWLCSEEFLSSGSVPGLEHQIFFL